MPLIKIDSWFARIGQGLAREKASTTDSKEDIRYGVRKINQYLYAEKPTVDLISKYANVIVDLLLSMHNSPDDFEFLSQILNMIREILDCDKTDDRGLGQEISLQIHQILAIIGHYDKRLALKARLFKTIACTIGLLRIYSYNAKISPVILTVLKIYAKNAITASAICRASGLQPLLRLALTLDRRHTKLQRLSITVVRHLTQTKKLAARATSTSIVRDILAVVFLMDKSQGQSRIRTIKIKEGLLKVLLNLVKSKTGRQQFLEANGFYLLYELAMNVLSNENFCTFLDLACQVMLHCCPKQQLPIDTVFSPIRYVLPQGYDYIVSNELLSADPQIIKDLDDLREKCRSAVPTNERNSNAEQRVRPKSSLSSSTTRAASASKSSPNSSTRPKSSKGTRLEKKLTEQRTIPKKKSNSNGTKHPQVSTLDTNELDEAEENGIRLVEDEELDDDDDSGKSDREDDDEEDDDDDDDDDDDRPHKENLSSSSVPLPSGESTVRDAMALSTAYERFFDELFDPIHMLRAKMSQTIVDPRTESLFLRLFRNVVPSVLTRLTDQSSFSYWRMPPDLYFQIYSILAKSTKSAYRFTKLAYPDAFNALSYPKFEPMQKSDERTVRSTLLSDIRRILYPPSLFNRTVYDFDAVVNRSSNTTLNNDDELRCQTRLNSDHLLFDSQFECGNLRKAIQITEEEYDLILRPDVNTFRYHQWFYFEISNMRRDLTYRFNIINFEKINSQFNSGMQPVMFSVRDALNGKPYWHRIGEKISYYKNTYGKKKKVFYTLTFNIRFPYENDVCYVAYHYPYTYTSLMTDLMNWSNTYDRTNVYFRQQVLCKTLSGNDCPLLTITNLYNRNDNQMIPLYERTYVILTSRVHPGESNASWVMKGIIDYLLSDEPTARVLRDRFIFKIIPMLNPDGVINGCQRCSLSTKDLNRQWSSPNSTLFPTIYHTKGLIAYLSTCSPRPITLFCDFHGHSRQKNFFFYGNDPRLHFLGPAIGRSTITKIFPKLFTGIPGFALQNCMFTMRKQKEGCARIVVWDEFKIDLAYTMEATYSGFDLGVYKGLQIQISTLQIIGHDFCQVLIKLADQELKSTEIIVPFEDLFLANNKRATNADERRRSSSTVSSSSSSSSICSLSSIDGGGQ